MSEYNKFRELTIEALKNGLKKPWKDLEKYLASGFTIADNDEEDCVLFMSINPAGDETNAEDEKNNILYLYEMDEITTGRYVNNYYFRPLKKLVEETLQREARWIWSKEDKATIEAKVKNDVFLSQYHDVIMERWERDHKKKTTIYSGELFYVHETDSNRLEMKKEWEKENGAQYAYKMLKLHVKEFKDKKKNLKYVFINNKYVSELLRNHPDIKNSEDKDCLIIDGTYVFLGRFLSRGCPSKIKEELKNKVKTKLGIS